MAEKIEVTERHVTLLRLNNWGELIKGASGTVQAFIKWGGVAFSAWCLQDAGIGVIQNLVVGQIGPSVSAKGSWVVTALALGYAWREKKLRRDAIERLGTRNAKLEEMVDPGRTSSNLLPDGTSPPEAT
jgi:hypothetical protein